MNNNCITTYTGRHIDPLHPDPDMICIEDIAHALSLICRGNGQVKTFFSVGQHCINCAREALARGYSRRVAFACLLHDASECYLSDVPRPFKKTLSGYKEKEKNLLDLIYQKYLGSSLNAKEEQLLKEIDDDMLWFDLTHLLNEPQEREAPEIHITIDYTVRAFEETEKEYLELYNHVTDERLTNEIQKLNSSKNMHFFKFNKNSQKKQITS